MFARLRKELVYCSKDREDWEKARSLLDAAELRSPAWESEEAPVGGCGGKIDVQVCDRNGTGLDGYVWVCRKGMEQVPTYRKDLREAGEAEFTFDFGGLQNAGSVSLLVTVTAEEGPAESSLALAQQDLTTGKADVQYKLASDTYQLSGTFELDAPVFQWK